MTDTITYFELAAITKTTPANYVPGILQQQHFINTSTNPEDRSVSNLIRQNDVNVATGPLKVKNFF